jgi:peptidoglycan/xylan/chitin deacetylase (PgdA/CDA1 family)
MSKLFLALSLFYLLIVIIIISFSEVDDMSIVYADYVPTPTFTQNTPQEFKQLFFSVAQDGENNVLPVTNSNVIFHGPRNTKEVALTFDADMTPWMKEQLISGAVNSYYNKELIDYLDQTHTKATLFLTGMWIELYQQDAQKLAADPLFELGSHSYSHPSFAGYCYGLEQITEDEKQPEIDKTQQLLFQLTHKQNTLFRFPGGCYDQDAINLLHKNSLQPIQWDVVGDDGFNDNTQGIIDNVVNNIQNGSIIVMHMNGYPNDPKTSEALPEIITTLKQRGYSFVTISELLSQNETSMKPNALQYFQNYLLSDKQTTKNGA